ncbi:MAG TPA: hypothetical protein VGO43_08135 [Pyrinomonadaceae bacterium]|nr:hypothetical protein [Pyrinomonadaceae bacterium]
MSTVFTEDVKVSLSTDGRSRPALPNGVRSGDCAVELGIWLAGLVSFLGSGPNAFFEAESATREREMRVLHTALRRCAMLNAMLLDPQTRLDSKKRDGLQELAGTLRDAILIGDAMIGLEKRGNAEWRAWTSTISHRLGAVRVVSELVRAADAAGDRNLPPTLLKLTETADHSTEHAELALVLPRFGRVLNSLSVIGGMLERDEPLKPAMVIFSRVNEQILELTTFIDNRLERFLDADAEVFSSLDAASYTASMELKKVYSHELAALAQLRPAPSVYARIETAYSLLNDGFQQILAGFVRLVDPSVDVFSIFPSFVAKREQSLSLRSELAKLVKLIQKAEAAPQDAAINAMQTAIADFMETTVRFLFYKDTETVERFVAEIMVTRNNEDLVPLLHRFGAYLETLLGQVGLRTVIATDSFKA